MNFTERLLWRGIVMFSKQSENEHHVVQIKNGGGEGCFQKLFETRMYCEAKATEAISFREDNKAYQACILLSWGVYYHTVEILLQVFEQCNLQCLEINVSGLPKQFQIYYVNILN